MSGKIWLAYLIAFVGGAGIMAIEVVAGRILAPYIGVSLYTWTTIIGLVLAGVSLGNLLGGFVADRGATRETLGLVLVASGLASAGVPVTTTYVVGHYVQVPLIPKIVLYTTVSFFLPSLLLGMVSPVVIKLALGSLKRSGRTVGAIYACSTAGSIFGTFLTGFWLISWVGTRAVAWIVALLLVSIGLAAGGIWRSRSRSLGLAGALLASGTTVWLGSTRVDRSLPATWVNSLPDVTTVVVVLLTLALLAIVVLAPRLGSVASALAILAGGLIGLGWGAGLYDAPCEVESNYFCIRAAETTVYGQEYRALVLDHLVHSYVSTEDPKLLAYGYERVYAAVTRYIAADREGLDTLFIGGGGYAFPRYVEAAYPHSTVDVLEIDPAVTAAAHDLLAMPRDTRIRSFNQDARAFLTEWPDPKRYDVIYGDAFNDLSVPYHLTTVEFGRLVASRLKADGVYVVNVIDDYAEGEFMSAFLRSLREVFPHVYLMAQGEAWEQPGANTYVLMASIRPLDRQRFREVTEQDATPRTAVLPSEALDAYLSSGRQIVLTDDYVPVDQLVARLFSQRGY